MTRLGDVLDFGQLLKPLATINVSKSPTFLGNFCKGVKIYHFSSEIIFGQLFWSQCSPLPYYTETPFYRKLLNVQVFNILQIEQSAFIIIKDPT